VVPPQFGLAGLGVSLGNLELAAKRLYAQSDVFVGWMGMPSRFAYHLRAGLGARLGPGTLLLAGYYANDRATENGQAFEGMELSYRVRFPQ
jgi:hypothetical protein